MRRSLACPKCGKKKSSNFAYEYNYYCDHCKAYTWKEHNPFKAEKSRWDEDNKMWHFIDGESKQETKDWHDDDFMQGSRGWNPVSRYRGRSW